MQGSTYGLSFVSRAISYCTNKFYALDVGCGSGGRIVDRVVKAGFQLEGIDISAKMLEIARAKHPGVSFHQADIIAWKPNHQYDLIVAWDSIFHLPMSLLGPTVEKLCDMLAPGGILLYTFGDAVGDHVGEMYGETFGYGAIGTAENLGIIAAAGCICRHLEMDQFPEKHVVVIVEKAGAANKL